MSIKMLLTALIFFTPFSIFASPWERDSWQLVGSGTFRWFLFDLYQASLYTPDGLWNEPFKQNNQACLVITYDKAVKAKKLRSFTEEQWQRNDVANTKIVKWKNSILISWPDIRKGDHLSFCRMDSTGAFWFKANSANASWTRIYQGLDDDFNQAFLAIWLSNNSEYPKFTAQLIGADK